MSADTLKSSVKSKNQNTHAQEYCTDYGCWIHAYPMKTERGAHHTLSLLFKDVGVPNQMVMDGAKTQTLGKFHCKARETDCRVKQTEPYRPFSNTAEGAICELRKAVNSQHPKAPNAYGMTASCRRNGLGRGTSL